MAIRVQYIPEPPGPPATYLDVSGDIVAGAGTDDDTLTIDWSEASVFDLGTVSDGLTITFTSPRVGVIKLLYVLASGKAISYWAPSEIADQGSSTDVADGSTVNTAYFTYNGDGAPHLYTRTIKQDDA